ncbi:maintenance-mitochondrial morphology protein 1 [Fusarium oxysporum f. sp. raphani 54005]|uniref:Maintenance of mitochondrial morphology protein 1 n=7 Tax=Fusarium oxysporum TaxID=5507 RepID=X0CMY7_FUSOX|nr:maintenance-mitochondrial morphology protein 1 [Fusarium oxysporum f. sp. lycopersici 4287]EWZ38311.1 maintenance-mitochondrial morphology protein 1 [Fusarium oxysporum Fo47]EWZ82872.1 maintenance-mitochondrial morphology protein 1 [Fusarium oxysporum f. sp. lycopersici MN25]EXA45905.1 maintenance-mitochondrial morphology protein 1 [Fusarium oxysporum f. sp. pisi HDV247]EXK40382.1 maintenance-mitochondrial morphology protein 1 [Fusarium oxysporum f. sp. melonis 26406]EXK92179.1 maintenance-
MEADTCPRLIEPTLSFTQGLIVGQLSVVLVLAAFIKFFIFGDPPSADVTASLRATERRSRTLAHKRSLLSIRSPANRGDRSQDRSLSPYYNVDSHQPESLDWFNVLIAQTIAQFRSDAQHDDAILDSLTKALNGDSRPDFIDEIRVTELSLGEDFPILSNCRIIPVDEDGVSLAPGKKFDPATAARDGLRLQARMDVDLSDMLTLAVRTKLILNYPKKLSAVLPVELAVSVIRFSGTLSISFIPSNPSQSTPTRMIFNFLDDYRLDFEIRSLLGSRSKLHNVPKIAQLVEARLHRWFDERAVEPRFQEIALPSLWPRKKNTRGPEDASTERSESIGRSRGNDAGRDHREEIRGRGGDAEIRDRGAGGTVRHRRGTRSNDSDDFSMPGSLPDFQVAAS